MSHMSGLPRDIPCMDIFEKGCSLSDSEILRNLAEIRLMYPPGTQPAYSNLGFGLLGKVITKIAKASSWDELMTKMVLQPMGMNDTGNSVEDRQDVAYGYYPDGSVANFIDIGWDSAAGQSYSSTADLAKLMSLIFNSEQSSKVQVKKKNFPSSYTKSFNTILVHIEPFCVKTLHTRNCLLYFTSVTGWRDCARVD